MQGKFFGISALRLDPMVHRNRRTPGSRPGDQQVSQRIAGHLAADPPPRELLDNPFTGPQWFHSAARARVGQLAIAFIGLDKQSLVIKAGRAGMNHLTNAQLHPLGEFELFSIVSGNSENDSIGIGVERQRRDQDRHLLQVDRIQGKAARPDTGSLGLISIFVTLLVGLDIFDVIRVGDEINDFMSGSDKHKGESIQRLQPGGEYPQVPTLIPEGLREGQLELDPPPAPYQSLLLLT